MKIPLLTALVPGLLMLATPGSAQQYNYSTIDVPCDSAAPTNCPNGTAKQTAAEGINPGGDIVGVFVDGAGVQHGFLLSRGAFTVIDVPGSLMGVEGSLPTSANGINPAGDIVGNFTAPVNASASADDPEYCPSATSKACIKGFLYHRGTFSLVLFPGHPGAIPQRISPNGDIYGCLHNTDLGNSMFGAVWTRFGGMNLTAGGGELADNSVSVPMSMNNGATPDATMIVGLFNNPSTSRHGFVVTNGVFQQYDVSGSTLTAIWDVNPGLAFVGTYVDASGRHGFLQLPDASAPINIDPTGSTGTIAYGINPAGAIVGQFSDSLGSHGFLAVPVK